MADSLALHCVVVGFWVDYTRFEIGMSERRVTWLVKFVEELISNEWLVHMTFSRISRETGLCCTGCLTYWFVCVLQKISFRNIILAQEDIHDITCVGFRHFLPDSLMFDISFHDSK